MELLPREVLLPCQIFGWLPLKYVENSGKRTLEFSNYCFFWGITVTLAYSAFSLLGLHLDFQGRKEGVPIRMVNETSCFTIIVDKSTLCIMGIIVFVSSTVKHPLLIDMFNSLQQIDENLQIQRKEAKFFKHKILTFLIWKTIVIIITIYCYTTLYFNYTVYIPYWITYWIQATVVVFFINLCTVIKERFCVINEKLRSEVINQSFGQLLRGVEECQSNIDFIPGGLTSTTNIRIFMEQYWLLCELMKKANKFLSWHLLVSVISLSIHTVIALFNLFSEIWPIIQPKVMSSLILRPLWVIIHTSELLMILRASTSTTDVANQTAPMVCKLLNRNLSAPLKNHLEMFLLSLRHQSAKFSALGLFEVHSHILTPIAGAVTTYLVILIQFQAQTPQDSYDEFSDHK